MFFQRCQHLGFTCRVLASPYTFSSLRALSHVRVAPRNVQQASCRNFSTESGKNDFPKEQDKKLTASEKFKKVYKEYGKTLIVVHATTSMLWFGTFYLLVISGVDLLPLLEKLNISEEKKANFLSAGDLIAAGILTTLARPVRYVTTLAITRRIVIYLRKKGYLSPAKS